MNYKFEKEIYDRSISRLVTTPNGTLCVKSFENGIATLDTMPGCIISSFAKVVAGCFDEDSNFVSELLKSFACDEGTEFTGIKFEFNGVTIFVTKENADADKIYAEWQVGMEANAQKHRLKEEAYMKTPEYCTEKALKLVCCKEIIEKDVIAVDEATELQFKDEEAAKNWEKWVADNSKDRYSLAVVTYARRLGKYMQYLMERHNKTVVDIVENASCASDIEGITDYMYGCAISMLEQCWKYGEELSKWHNKE